MTTTTKVFDKVVRDGKVAVLKTEYPGSGWYSWYTNIPELLFLPRVVEIILNENLDDTVELFEDYMTGTEKQLAVVRCTKELFASRKKAIATDYCPKLEVVWVPEGTEFRVEEEDGLETLIYREDDTWFTA